MTQAQGWSTEFRVTESGTFLVFHGALPEAETARRMRGEVVEEQQREGVKAVSIGGMPSIRACPRNLICTTIPGRNWREKEI